MCGMAITVKFMRSAERIVDISEKDPYHAFPAETPLRTLLPLFASGLHRIAVTSIDSVPQILTDASLLEYLISLPSNLVPHSFSLAVTSPSLNLPLHPFLSLSGNASVLDAMQVMSTLGLSALGVLSGPGSNASSHGHRESSGSNSSSNSGSVMPSTLSPPNPLTSSPLLIPSLSPGLDVTASPLDSVVSAGELMSFVTARDCTTLVVPSEGKQVLGMVLQQMIKGIQVVEHAGKTRGEEKMPSAYDCLFRVGN